jgi:hypothetical protein
MLSRKYSNRGSLNRGSRPLRPGNRRLSKLDLNSKNNLKDNSNPGAKSTNSLKKSLKEGVRNMDGRRVNGLTTMPSTMSVA